MDLESKADILLPFFFKLSIFKCIPHFVALIGIHWLPACVLQIDHKNVLKSQSKWKSKNTQPPSSCYGNQKKISSWMQFLYVLCVFVWVCLVLQAGSTWKADLGFPGHGLIRAPLLQIIAWYGEIFQHTPTQDKTGTPFWWSFGAHKNKDVCFFKDREQNKAQTWCPLQWIC